MRTSGSLVSPLLGTSLTELTVSYKKTIQVKLQLVRDLPIQMKICLFPVCFLRDPTNGLCNPIYLQHNPNNTMLVDAWVRKMGCKTGQNLLTWVSTGKSSCWRWNIKTHATCNHAKTCDTVTLDFFINIRKYYNKLAPIIMSNGFEAISYAGDMHPLTL